MHTLKITVTQNTLATISITRKDKRHLQNSSASMEKIDGIYFTIAVGCKDTKQQMNPYSQSKTPSQDIGILISQIILITSNQHNNQNQSKNTLQEDLIIQQPSKDLKVNYPPHTLYSPPSSKQLLKENKSQSTSHLSHLPVKLLSLQ